MLFGFEIIIDCFPPLSWFNYIETVDHFSNDFPFYSKYCSNIVKSTVLISQIDDLHRREFNTFLIQEHLRSNSLMYGLKQTKHGLLTLL